MNTFRPLSALENCFQLIKLLRKPGGKIFVLTGVGKDIKQFKFTISFSNELPGKAVIGFTDLMKGDMLLTGTPGGVILNANLKVGLAIIMNFTNDEKRREKLIRSQKGVRYLQPGDQLKLSLETKDGSRHFGSQRNTIRDAT